PGVRLNAYLAEFGHSGGFAADAPSYGFADSRADGRYVLTLVLPDFWPNGNRIDDGRLLIVIATSDFGSQASASIEYNRANAAAGLATDPTATPLPTEAPLPTDTPLPTDVPLPTDTPLPTVEPTALPTELPTEVPT